MWCVCFVTSKWISSRYREVSECSIRGEGIIGDRLICICIVYSISLISMEYWFCSCVDMIILCITLRELRGTGIAANSCAQERLHSRQRSFLHGLCVRPAPARFAEV